MIDAQRLLSQFLGSGSARSGQSPTGGYSSGSSGNALQDGIGKLLGGALGGSSRGGSSSGGLGGALSGGLGGAVPAALAGGVASYLLKNKGAKQLGGSALKLGGIALVAGLGYKAWQNYQAQNAGAQGQAAGRPLEQPGAGYALPRPVAAAEIPSAEGTRFLPTGTQAETRARLLLSAMIAAAKADGYIDQTEEQAIFGRIDDLELDAESKGLLFDEMRKPRSLDELVAGAGDEETAIEIYTASLLAIDPDHPAEQAYLQMLAARLNLAPELVAEIKRTAAEAQA